MCGRQSKIPNAWIVTLIWPAWPFNKPLTWTDAKGNVTSYTYDTQGNLKTVTQPVVAKFGASNAAPVTTNTYNSRGQVLTTTDPEGRVTSYTYDPTYGHLLTKTEGSGVLNLTTTFGYDGVGNVTTKTDARSATTTDVYDSLRRLVEEDAPAALPGIKTTYTYDKDSRQTSISQATGNPSTPWKTTSTTYDADGDKLVVTAPDATTTTYAYDTLRRVSTKTSSSGRQVLTEYDAASRPTKTTDQVSGTLDPSITSNLGAVVREQRTYVDGMLHTFADGKGNALTFTYDGLERLEYTDYPGGTFEADAYDANDNILVLLKRSGGTIGYGYHALNRKTTKVPTGETPVFYGYDLSGKLVAARYNTESTYHQFLFDAAGRKFLDYSPYFGSNQVNLDGDGNITALGSPSTAPASVTSYTYDALNRLTSAYDGAPASGIAFGNYSYDLLSQRTGLSYGPTSAPVASSPWTWTPIGKAQSITHNWNGTAVTLTYAYNSDGQRSGVAATDATFLANSPPASTLSYTTNALNQYATVNGGSFTYDTNGDLTSYRSWTLGFNTEGQLITATKTGTTINYFYDPIGRLLEERKRKPVVVEFVWRPPGSRIYPTFWRVADLEAQDCLRSWS